MGFFDVFKKSRKEVNHENRYYGKEAEEQARREYELNGYEVEKIHRGGDLKVRKRDWLTGKKGKPTIVEVKSGNSKLSDLQKKRKRQYGDRFVEKRYERTPLGLVPTSRTTEHKSRTKSSGFDDKFGFGSSSNKRNKRSNDYGFGSGLDNMFGSSNSGSRKRKSDGFDSMFGMGGTSKSKRKRSSGSDSMFGF